MTKVNTIAKKIGIALACLMVIFAMMMGSVIPALAADEFGLEEPITLTASITGDAENLSGVEFKAYRIATMDSTPTFTVESKYASFGIDFSGIDDQSEWNKIADTVEAYIVGSGLTPEYTATSKEGMATFGEVEPGLYLVRIADFVDEENLLKYTFDSALVTAPMMIDEEWIATSVFSPKYTSTPEPPPSPSTSALEVIKLWKDENVEGVTRPEEIEIELVCEGQTVETVKLNKENGWKYKWNELDGTKTYYVTEKKVPEGYSVSMTVDDGVVTVTNTAKPPTTPPTTPPSTPPTTPPTTTTNTPPLPDTGYHWMPAIVLGGAGIVFFVLGAIRKKTA